MRLVWSLMVCFLTACTTPDTVTLVRNLGDAPATVTVEGAGQTHILTAPGETVDLRETGIKQRTRTETRTEKELRALGAVLDTTPVTAPPATTQHYTIPFASGSAVLPLEAERTLATVLTGAQRPGVVVEITGHTDRVGRDEANEQLSRQRAVAVQETLLVRGLPASRLRVMWYGERHPLVPTADGVAEVLNRRVQITVREEEYTP
jgi:outer membrane protein OmpA-like peptidoglycan-associated protein